MSAMDEDFLVSLPDEPELAFGPYEDYVRQKLGERGNGRDWEFEYVQYIEAFIHQHSFEIRDLPPKSLFEEDVGLYYLRFLAAAGVSAKKSFLARASVARTSISPPYSLSVAEKAKIRHYIEKIREEIARAAITTQKRDALSNRLNAFAVEVDRDRTRLDALTAFYFSAKKEAKEELKPVFDLIGKINDVIEGAQEWVGLPGKDENKQLPATRKRIEGPKNPEFDPNDDIPF